MTKGIGTLTQFPFLVKIKIKMEITDKLSRESREKLIEIMADSPTLFKFEGTEFEVRALHNGTLIKICEEAIGIKEIETKEGDRTASVMVAMATQIPILCRVVTYALLNDLDKINKHFDEVYNIILNKTTQKDLLDIFYEIIQKLDVSFFFANIESVVTLFQMMTDRRMTEKEQEEL